MTWKELLNEAAGRLKTSGIVEYEPDAWYLFSEAFGLSRAKYFLCRDQEIGEDGEVKENQLQKFRRWIDRRCDRIPLQQIVGHQEFMGLDFLVNEHVLIPRQDTEVLVEWVLDRLRSLYEARYVSVTESV